MQAVCGKYLFFLALIPRMRHIFQLFSHGRRSNLAFPAAGVRKAQARPRGAFSKRLESHELALFQWTVFSPAEPRRTVKTHDFTCFDYLMSLSLL